MHPPSQTVLTPNTHQQATVAPLRRMQDAGYRMAASRAFLHQYEAHGLEEAQLLAGFAAVEDTLAAYEALG